jgi:hypothetical protein
MCLASGTPSQFLYFFVFLTSLLLLLPQLFNYGHPFSMMANNHYYNTSTLNTNLKQS